VGYKVHLTESCEEDQPHLITHVVTTAAPVADSDVVDAIHDDVATADLLPAVHLVDTGYVDARHLVSSRTRHDIDSAGTCPWRLPSPGPQWRDRLLLLNAFAVVLLTLLGAAGESLGMISSPTPSTPIPCSARAACSTT